VAIKAVTFDFWRTLFRENERDERTQIRIDAFIEATGAPVDEVMPAFEKTWGEFLRHHIEEQRTLRPQDAVRLTAEALDITLEDDVFTELTEIFGTAILRFPPIPIDDALEAVQHSAAHVPVGIISDSGISPGTSLRKLLLNHGFSKCLSNMVFSDELGVAKPQAAMYHEAARGLGVHVTELLHIGDLQPTDIIGAQNVGASAALFAGDNARFYDKTTAEHSFRSWREFIDRFTELELDSAT